MSLEKRQLSSEEQFVHDITESGRYKCPQPECRDRKKSNLKTLSVDCKLDHNLFDCHHCGWQGRINTEWRINPTQRTEPVEKVTNIRVKLDPDKSKIDEWFAARGIDTSAIELKNKVTLGRKYFAQLGEETDAIGFVYGDMREPDAVKWRPLDGRKAFTQDGRAATFYGEHEIPPDAQELIVVEGEADQIALQSIGIASVSVPNGAPMKISNHRVEPEEDKKFSFVWTARDLLDRMKRITVAADEDEAGAALLEELARRIGRARVWKVSYPEDCKDVTDVISRIDAETAIKCIESAEPMPLQGVYSASDYFKQIDEIYEKGLARGEATGFPNLDEIMSVKEGQVYIVTGYPGSGKSEWVDAIMLNLSVTRQWKWAVASFENPPAIHQIKLAEKYVGKPFFEGATPRMNRQERDEAKQFIDDHFAFLESRGSSLPTMKSILDRTLQSIMRLGCRGLVIDPYNFLTLPKDISEHKAIEQMLSEVGAFARANGVAIFFIAHPQKVPANQNGEYPIPKGNHISGSAAWWSKADFGVTIHRGEVGTEVHTWKVRFKWLGEIGMRRLGYDKVTGRYYVPTPEPDDHFKRSGSDWDDVAPWET